MSAQEFIPPEADTLDELKAAAAGCHGCELWEHASQTAFGRGAAHARVVFVGEQPGDVEDQKGLPFVGPAGHLLRRAVDDAGIDPSTIYITNAVKHFRFEMRGKRRIHQTPGPQHITACRPWLVAEFSLLRPEIVVVLGATAAKALLGPDFRVTRSRGQLLPWPASAHHPEDFQAAGPGAAEGAAKSTAERAAKGAAKRAEMQALATIHPSAVLRADNRDLAYQGLVDDLKVVAKQL